MTGIGAALLLVQAAPAAAQDPATVAGTVRDSAGRPLARAVVAVPRAGRTTLADASGGYRLVALPPGRLVIEVRLLGYHPARDSVLLAPGDSATLDFTLRPSALDVPGVVVTAAKRSQLIEEAVSSVAVVEETGIARRALNTVDEALDRAPGVQVLDGQVNIRGSTGYSRGLGSRVLLLVDGVPANQGDRGGINWDLLPVDQIERAEIVKGAGSALYGSAALGGVVNLITRDIPPGLHWRVRATGGVFANPPYAVWRFRNGTGYQGGLDAGASYGTARVGGRFAIGARTSDGYREQDQADHWQAAGRGRWRSASGASQLAVSGAWAVDDYQVPLTWCVAGQCDDRGQRYQPFQIDTALRGERTDSRKGYLTALLERTTMAGLVWTARGSWLRTRFTNTHPVNADFSVANRLGGELRAVTRRGPQTVTVGGEGARTDVTSDIFSGSDSLDAIGRHTQGEYAAYGEAETPLPGARLTLGARIDFLAVDGGGLTAVVSPRGGVVRATRRGSWRATAGRGFRAPAIAERFVTTVLGPFRVIPNPALRPETAWSFEVGTTTALTATLLLDAAVFWTEAEDFIEPALLPSGSIQFQNLVRARLRGLDASVSAALARGRLQTTAAYLYLDARELAHGSSPERPLNFRPEHLVTLGLDYDAVPRLVIGADFRYASRVERVDLFPDDERVPTSVLDLRAAWEGRPIAVRVRLANALNYIYTQVPRTLAPVRTLSVVATWTR